MAWVPLEANPELFTAWCERLGLDTQRYAFHDVFGLDEELLAMVPQPVQAVLFLFPITPDVERRREVEDAVTEAPPHSELLWFKQTIGNACGTIGLLHAVANSAAADAVRADMPLAHLLAQARTLSPEARTQLLADSEALRAAHAATAQEGQTAAPDAHADVDLHFVALVRGPHGELVELDGRRRGPVERGSCGESLLQSAAHFVQQHYMAADPDQVHFNLIALGPAT